MNKTKFFTNWLVATGILIIIMGLYMALLNTTPLFTPLNAVVDPVCWPNGISDPGTLDFKAWIFSLGGVLFTVWGIFLLFIVNFSFRKGELWAWVSIAVTTGVWFAVDESASVYFRIYINAIGNLVFLLMLVIPLVFTWKTFFSKEHRKKNL